MLNHVNIFVTKDRRQHKAAIIEANKNIADDWRETCGLGWGNDKQSKLNLRIAEWKENKGFTGAYYTELIQYRESKSVKEEDKLLPWGRVCVKFGGEKNALQALQEEDVTAIRDPRNPNAIKYIINTLTYTKSRELTRDRAMTRSAELTDSFFEALGDNFFDEIEDSFNFDCLEDHKPAPLPASQPLALTGSLVLGLAPRPSIIKITN